jgi:hypothetical protein
MFRRLCAALAAGALIGGLLGAAPVLASDGLPSICDPVSVSGDEDHAIGGTATCVVLEAGDQYQKVGGPSNGSVNLDPDTGSFTYTPDPDFNGSDAFTYQSTDADGSNTATVSINVASVNDRPSFNPGPDASVAENSGAFSDSGWASGVDRGAPDESGQAVDYVVTGDTNSSLFSTPPDVSSSGTLTFTPAANTSGSATITLHIHDDGGNGNGGKSDGQDETFQISVTSANNPPSFTKGGDQAVLEDSGSKTVNGWATGIDPGAGEGSQNVTFVVSNNNTSLFSSQPAVNGSSGNLTFTPAANQFGAATVTLHAHDDGGGTTDDSPSQSFTITVTGVNDPPSFTKGGNQSVAENAGSKSVSGWATSISEGPGEGSQTVAFTVTNNNNGLFSAQPAVSPTGTLTYTTATSASGAATVSVFLKDNGGTANSGDDTSATQTFTIDVSGVNDPPSFNKGANEAVLEDSGGRTVSGWATSISAGPPDESGQSVSFVVTNNNNALFSSQPAVSGSSGNLTFTPAPNAVGTATVTLHAHDSAGADSPQQTFAITVTPVNDAPSFTKGPDQTVLEDSGAHTVNPWIAAMSAGPPDEAAQTLTFVVVSNNLPAMFSVPPSVGSGGVLTYTLAPNASGIATIGIQLHDNGTTANGGRDSSPTQTFRITATGQNDAPTCTNATDATFVGTTLNGSLTTCTDIDGDSLHFALVAQASHGTASVNGNGSFSYAPNAAFQGNDAFTFRANDGTVDSNVVSMSILVSPDPIAKNDVAPTDFPAVVQGSGPTAIPVLANDQDKQGGPLTILSVTQGSKGKVAITGGGTGLTYDPTSFATGNDSFHYTITDSQNRTNSAIVLVVIRRATPTGSRPMATIVGHTTLGSTTTGVRISWSAADVGTGLRSFRLQESYNGGTFRTVRLANVRSRSVLRRYIFGKSYRYRLKVTDSAGNVSPWSTSPTFIVGRSQETSVGIAYSGAWGLASSAIYSGGKARWASVAGASATFSFNGESVAWVSTRGPTRGSAQVLIDGVLVRTVSLFSSRRTARQVVFSTAWPAMGLHTIQIVVLGTPGHPRVDVDTFVLAR